MSKKNENFDWLFTGGGLTIEGTLAFLVFHKPVWTSDHGPATTDQRP